MSDVANLLDHLRDLRPQCYGVFEGVVSYVERNPDDESAQGLAEHLQPFVGLPAPAVDVLRSYGRDETPDNSDENHAEILKDALAAAEKQDADSPKPKRTRRRASKS